jgi:hypothetical protein
LLDGAKKRVIMGRVMRSSIDEPMTGESIMYVHWTNHTVQLTATKVKEVTCEKCRTQYAYALSRSEFGTATSVYGIDEEGAHGRAAGTAATKLDYSLFGAFELVPCPSCGAYQAQMVTFLKNAHLKWMILIAGLLVIAAAVLFCAGMAGGNSMLYRVSLALFVAAVGMIAYRAWSASRYDPNFGDPEPRKELARSMAFLKSDSAPPLDSPQSAVARHRRRLR